MIPDCDRQTVRRSDGWTESIIAKTALCIASYADALSIKDRTISILSFLPRDDLPSFTLQEINCLLITNRGGPRSIVVGLY